MHEDSGAVLRFWFDELSPQQHFVKDEAVDRLIAQRFTNIHRGARQGELYSWRDVPQGRLAEIIVLDQFSRNLHRDDAQAYACDGMALVLAQEAVRAGADRLLPPPQRAFLYMPYMHSESALVHAIAAELFDQPGFEDNFKFELAHKAVIERFGRYPHRNAALGRPTTASEEEFLAQSGRGF